jgi:hypothetical protein
MMEPFGVHDLISVTRVLTSSIQIDNDIYLDTFKPRIDKDVCQHFEVDFINALNSESVDEKSITKSFKSVYIPIAAATLSYARINIFKLFKYILDNGGIIYYTDTDSIVTNLKLPEDFIRACEAGPPPSQLGKLKLEHEIVEGYFVADKTYAFINTKGDLIKKAKGINSEYLTFNDYKKYTKKDLLIMVLKQLLIEIILKVV